MTPTGLCSEESAHRDFLPKASGWRGHHVMDNVWFTFLAGAAAILLTFLAGAELDPRVFRRKWREADVIGLVGFFAPWQHRWHSYFCFSRKWSPRSSGSCQPCARTTTKVGPAGTTRS